MVSGCTPFAECIRKAILITRFIRCSSRGTLAITLITFSDIYAHGIFFRRYLYRYQSTHNQELQIISSVTNVTRPGLKQHVVFNLIKMLSRQHLFRKVDHLNLRP
jgi:hypothetical protein